MEMSVDRSGATLTLTLAGAVDATTAYQPYEEAVAAFDQGPATGGEQTSDVVLDLAGVTFADSTALGTFVRIREVAAQHGASCHLRSAPRRLMDLLTMTGLDRTFDFS